MSSRLQRRWDSFAQDLAEVRRLLALASALDDGPVDNGHQALVKAVEKLTAVFEHHEHSVELDSKAFDVFTGGPT